MYMCVSSEPQWVKIFGSAYHARKAATILGAINPATTDATSPSRATKAARDYGGEGESNDLVFSDCDQPNLLLMLRRSDDFRQLKALLASRPK